ncbi:MAG: ATP-binding protein [Deltaproteobacteria bacterium]|nr:ATP-binding protein [Deltaproteobacteria bacterium]
MAAPPASNEHAVSDPIEVRTTQVDLSGLMTVLGEHLYSTPTVAIRELVQNAHDSCVRRKMEAGEGFEAKIVVRADATARTLTVEDTGAGLTHDEIVQYLATVGAGYTRKLREQTGSDDLIGLFGLGFLSAFVIGERISVSTTSYQEPDRGWHYQSKTGERYTLEAAPPRAVGTVVELVLKEKFQRLADPEVLRGVLRRYCAILHVPVFAGDDETAVNAERPPWRDDADRNPLRARKIRLDFAARFERRFSPICTFDVPAPDHAADVRGLLWVQDGATFGTSDNRNLSVFVRGMLLDDDARELLPPWAGFAGGVIESDRLTPTASREDLQRDDQWAKAARALQEALIHGLDAVARREPEAWRRVLLRHNEALLGAALCDQRLFELLADDLTVPTSEGDLPVRAILRRSDRKVYVSLSTRGGFEEMLFRALKVPIAVGTRYAVLPFLERYADRRGAQVVQLGTHAGNQQVFREATVEPDERAFLERALSRPGQRLVTARFQPVELPLVLVPDREVELKKRLEGDEADKRIATAALGLARLYTKKVDDTVVADLYVNLDSPAIAALLSARGDDARSETGARLLRALVALMSGGGDGAPGVDLSETLAEYTAAVCALLDARR